MCEVKYTECENWNVQEAWDWIFEVNGKSSRPWILREEKEHCSSSEVLIKKYLKGNALGVRSIFEQLRVDKSRVKG